MSFTPVATLREALPAGLQSFLAECPRAGRGVHSWLFRAALRLHAYLEPRDVERMLAACTEHCGREVSEREIANAVDNSYDGPGAERPRSPGWPDPNPDKIAAALRGLGSFGVEQLQALSPVRLRDEAGATERVIDALFPDGDPLLCAGPNNQSVVTQPRSQWRGRLGALAKMVPSPMRARTGVTQGGRRSARCLDNVGPRQHLVVEFDETPPDEQAALLWHLGQRHPRFPLVLVVSSGNRSLHGWLACAGQDEAATRRLMREAVTLGADPATWTACQLVRVPGGRRETGEAQTILYFDPSAAAANNLVTR